MSFESTLAHARRRTEEAVMNRSCRVERREQGAFNPDTGRYDRGDATVVYAGKCSSVMSQGPGVRFGNTGEQREMVQTTYLLYLPWSSDAAGDVTIHDVVVTDSGAEYAVNSVDDSEARKARYIYLVDQET